MLLDDTKSGIRKVTVVLHCTALNRGTQHCTALHCTVRASISGVFVAITGGGTSGDIWSHRWIQGSNRHCARLSNFGWSYLLDKGTGGVCCGNIILVNLNAFDGKYSSGRLSYNM